MDGSRNAKRRYCQRKKGHSYGRPSSSNVPDNVNKLQTLIEENESVSLRHLADLLYVGKDAVRTMLTQSLNMRKICSVWVPYALTEIHKQQRVQCCQEDVRLFHELGIEQWCRRYVITDESWVSFSPTPWRRDLKKWTAKNDARPRAI